MFRVGSNRHTDSVAYRDMTRQPTDAEPPAVPEFPHASTDRGVSPRVLIGCCTLEEAQNVQPLLAALRRSMPAADLLIVDDGSTDGTAELAERFASRDDGGTRVIVRAQRGLGGAIRRVLSEAVEGDYEWVVNLDADFSHPPDAVPALIARAIGRPDVDVVIGSRYTDGGRIVGWPWRRRLMSRIVNRIATRRLGLDVSDCSGSMRCYRVAALRGIDPATLRSPGYSILEEVLVRLADRAGRPCMAEVPITFTERRAGRSKLTPMEALRSLRRIWSLKAA